MNGDVSCYAALLSTAKTCGLPDCDTVQSIRLVRLEASKNGKGQVYWLHIIRLNSVVPVTTTATGFTFCHVCGQFTSSTQIISLTQCLIEAKLMQRGRLWTEYGCRTADKDHILCNLCGRECAAHRRSATTFKRHLKARHGLKNVRSLRNGAPLRTLRQAKKSASRSPAALGDRLRPRKEASLGKSERPSSSNRYVRAISSGKQKAETSEDAPLGFVVSIPNSRDQLACTFRDKSLPTSGDYKSNWKSHLKDAHDIDLDERNVGPSSSGHCTRTKDNARESSVQTCISLNRLADGKAVEKSKLANLTEKANLSDSKPQALSSQQMSHAKRQGEDIHPATIEAAGEDCSVCRLVRPESWKTFGHVMGDGNFIACKLCSSQFPFPNGSVDVFIRHVAHMHVNHRGAGSRARRRNSEVVRRCAADPSIGLDVEQGTEPSGSTCDCNVKECANSSIVNVLTSHEQRRASYPSEASRVTKGRPQNERLRSWPTDEHGGASNACLTRKCDSKETSRSEAIPSPVVVTHKLLTISGFEKTDDAGGNVDRKAHKRGRLEDASASIASSQGSASKIQRSLISNDLCPAEPAVAQSTSSECVKASRDGGTTAEKEEEEEEVVAEAPGGGLLFCRKCDERINGGAKILPCFHILCSPCFKQQLVSRCTATYAKRKLTSKRLSTSRPLLSKAEVCVICENVASYFCENCEDNLCERCSQAHLLVKYTRDHVMRQAECPKKAELCSQHNVSMAKFCVSCSASVCEQCVLESHAEHNTEPVSSLVTKVKQEMLTVRRRANDLHDELGKAIQKVIQQQRAWEDHKCWLITLLTTFFHRVQEMMLDREVRTVEKLKGDMNKESSALQKRRLQYESLDSSAQLIASLSRIASLQNDPKPLLCAQKLFNNYVKVLSEQIPTRVPEVKPYALSLPFKEIKELLDRLDQSVTRCVVDMNAG
ncbi:hypothetical protein M514_01521 [Trichuris suis]|uniref:B box-type domain-containing protein n=1 Tax=Trichuris suis TaxID=68888 RepID=A0A085NAM8_9BILA|nr:hypothetical protein M514_01521 [Trichuris suis]